MFTFLLDGVQVLQLTQDEVCPLSLFEEIFIGHLIVKPHDDCHITLAIISALNPPLRSSWHPLYGAQGPSLVLCQPLGHGADRRINLIYIF